jgi:hypothetical protein
LYEAIRQHLLTEGEIPELDWRLAGRLCEPRVVFTFDGEIATADHTVEFVSAHHPLVRVVRAAIRGMDPPPAAGSLLVEAPDVTPGHYAFYVFRIQISGVRPSLELEPVAVTPNGAIADELTKRLIPLITRARAGTPSPPVDDDFVSRTHEAAVAWMDDRRSARETEIRRLADARIDAQLQSVDLGHERRMARIDARLAYERHPNMVRLLNGQRRNLERRHARKRLTIESNREVAVGYETVAAGVIEVAAPVTPAGARG